MRFLSLFPAFYARINRRFCVLQNLLLLYSVFSFSIYIGEYFFLFYFIKDSFVSLHNFFFYKPCGFRVIDWFWGSFFFLWTVLSFRLLLSILFWFRFCFSYFFFVSFSSCWSFSSINSFSFLWSSLLVILRLIQKSFLESLSLMG